MKCNKICLYLTCTESQTVEAEVIKISRKLRRNSYKLFYLKSYKDTENETCKAKHRTKKLKQQQLV